MTEARLRVPHAVRLRHSRDKVQGEETDPAGVEGDVGWEEGAGETFSGWDYSLWWLCWWLLHCLSKLTELHTKMGGSHNM